MRVLLPAGAVAVSGLALYFTRSVLDVLIVDGRPLRVALLPGWPVLAAFLAMATLAVLWLARRAMARTAGSHARQPRVGPAVTSAPIRLRVGALTLPLFALAVLIVPYLPVLPDRFPALQLAAGPLKWIVWPAVAGLFFWTLWQRRVVRADSLARLSVGQATLLIAVVTALASGSAAARLAGTVQFPGGDEPHYLIIAQSIWRDGDLKIENNHARQDYGEYFWRDELKPDYLTRGADGEIYSIHPIGMPVLMTPIYAFAGYWGVVIALVLCASAAAAIMWRFVVDASNAPGAATFAWAAIALTAPFLFNTFTVYPEIVAALAAAVAFTLSTNASRRDDTVRRWLIVGVACAALPWLSTKYAPMSGALLLVALARVYALAPVAPAPRTLALSHPRTLARAAAVTVPYVASVAAWFAFFHAVWGNPLPSAPYGDLVQTSIANTMFGVPGLLFDQEYGVLAYAPVYILAATGLFAMWRARGELRRRSVETALVLLPLLGTVGAFRIWWGGTASPSRPLASGLLLLALPIAVAFRSAAAGSARRAAQHLLLGVSVAIALMLATRQDGMLLNNGRDGTSTLLEYWSTAWPAWSYAPTFILHEAPTAWLHALAWLAVAAAAGVVLRRLRLRTAGGAALAALTTFLVALLLASTVTSRLPQEPPFPALQLQARSRLALLDAFDRSARPIAIRYDPFDVAGASEIVPLATLSVRPGERADPQPLRVLHNGRFSLPAGRYHVGVEWAFDLPHPAPISLQVGRAEPALQTWTVQPARGAPWGTEVNLPVDANFVALRGDVDLERAIARVAFTPAEVVDAGDRARVPPIVMAAQFGSTTVLFHDDQSTPEPTGFWVLGNRRSRVTFAHATDESPLVLRVHSGLKANRVTISMRGWQETLKLFARAPQEITLPDSTRRIVTIEIHPADGFYPRDFDPSAPDLRFLGAWVEIANHR
jgi:hypothetical protein